MYNIESRPCSKNGYFSPQEARNYYGRYARDGVTIHWWGDGTGANNHDNIVNYFISQSSLGNKSVNYVLSDNKITEMVSPDNVAWASQSGNATTISIEHQPTLGNEGYKKSGWLIWQLELRYGKRLALYPHSYWFGTACPGSISIDRIRQEADRWARGEYNPAPAQEEWVVNKKPLSAVTTMYALNNAKLVNVNDMSVIKVFPLDTPMEIKGYTVVQGKKFWLTTSSYDGGRPTGFLESDLKPTPTPAPPVEQPKPEWVVNLKDVEDTKYWFTKDQDLIDITTGKSTGKTFKKNEEFVGSALTAARNVEYRITEYSRSKGIFNGVPISSLTLTPPGVPDVPPVPQTPTVEERLGKLEALVDKIVAFLKDKLGFN